MKKLILIFTMLIGSHLQAGPAFTYQGRLLTSGGSPVSSSSVAFKIQIYTPGAEHCLMYEETQTKDLSQSSGVFAIGLNDGSGTRTDSSGYSVSGIFSNLTPFTFASGQCLSGTTYNPAFNDTRGLQLLFNEGSGWETIPTQAVNFVPQALDALQVGGFTPSSLVRVANSSGPQAATALTPANFTELLALVNGTSTHYLESSSTAGTVLPVLSSAPSTPSEGTLWYDSSSHNIKIYNGSTTQTLGISGSGLSSLTVSSSLTANGTAGGTLSAPGTIDLAPVSGLTAGPYTKITLDIQGRATAGATLAEADIPNLVTAGKVSGSTITSGTIAGTTIFNTSGGVTTTGTITGQNVIGTNANFRSIQVTNGSNQSFTITPPGTITGSPNLVLPGLVGGAGSVLSNDGAGNLSWITPNAGSVTGVSGSAPITVGGTAAVPVVGVSAATTGSTGVVTLAASGGTIASTVVQATDARLADARVPSGAAGGDLSGTYPNPEVAKIQGIAVSSTTPTTNGQTLRYVSGSTNYVPGFIGVGDIRSTLSGNAQFFPTTCTSSQVLNYQSVTDTFVCTNVTVTSFSGSLAGDVTGTQGATVVSQVGTSTAANVHAAEVLANAATNANTASTIVKRDVSGNFSANGVSESSTILRDSGPNAVTLQAPSAVTTSYALKFPPAAPGTAGQIIASDTSGNLSWVSPTAGSVTSVSVTSPLTNSGTASVPSLAIQQASTSQAGYLSSADWTTFNSKLAPALTSANIFVGNASNVAIGVAMSGDASISSAGAVTVKKIQGTSVSATAPTFDGQTLRYVSGSTNYSPAFLGVSDIRSTLAGNAQFFPTTCTSSQTLTYQSVSDTFVCTNVAVTNFSGNLTGDVTGTQGATVVSQVGTSTAANVHAAEVLANAATNANTASAIVERDASGNFSASGVSESSTILRDSGSNTVTLQAPSAVTTSYSLKFPIAVPGTAGQIMASDTSGNLSWVSPTAGSVTSISVTSPLTNSGTASVPSLAIQQASGTQGGYLSSADWTTFNSKTTSTLPSANIFVGNVSNVATAVAMSGDASISNAGAVTVKKIQGTSVSAMAPTTDGQILRYVSGSTNYAPAFIGVADIRSTAAGNAQMFPGCTSAAQTMTYNSVSDTYSCSAITVTASNFASQSANAVFAGPTSGSGAPSFRSLATSDIPSISSGLSGTLPLVNGGTGTNLAAVIGGAVYSTSTGLGILSPGLSGYVLTSGGAGAVPTWSPSSDTTKVSKSGDTMSGNLTISGITSGDMLDVTSTSTAANANDTGVNVAVSGSNGTSAITRYGIRSNVTSTGTTSTNVGGYFSASGATNNYGLLVNSGNVGIGTSSPSSRLHVGADSTASANYGTVSIGASAFDGTTAGYFVGSSSGTQIAGNAGSSYAGNLMDLQVAGSSKIKADNGGNLTATGSVTFSGGYTLSGSGNNITIPGHSVPNFSAGVRGNRGGVMGMDASAVGTPNLGIFSGSVEAITVRTSGNVGIGISSPTAKLNIAAGTTTLAPIQLTSGTNLSTPLSGAIEYDGTNLYFTNSTPTRMTLATTSGTPSFAGDVTMGGAGTGLAVTNNETVGGTLAITGATTLSGGATVAANQNLSMASGTGQFSQTYSGTGPAASVTDTSSASGDMLDITSTSTVASNNDSGINVNISGANATSSVTRYGIKSSVISTGTSATNVGGYFSASGATNNYGLLVPNGNVGIGTTSPASPLSIQGTNPSILLSSASNNSGNESILFRNYSSGGAKTGIISTAVGSYGFGTLDLAVNSTTDGSTVSSSDSLINLSSAGVKIIGPFAINNTPVANILSLNPSSGNNFNLKIATPLNAGTATLNFNHGGDKVAILSTAAGSWSQSTGLQFAINNSADGTVVSSADTKMIINPIGNVGIGTNSPSYALDVIGTIRGYGITDSSDLRLKKDVKPLSDSLQKILSLRGVNFQWRDNHQDQSPQVGLIAQEVEEVYPELVKTDREGMKSVNYSHLVAPLVESTKEIYERTTLQENELKALKDETTKLKKTNEVLISWICSQKNHPDVCHNFGE